MVGNTTGVGKVVGEISSIKYKIRDSQTRPIQAAALSKRYLARLSSSISAGLA